MHTPEHVVPPCGQTQAPPAHVADAGHAAPQAPQLAGSVDALTQLEPHDVRPTAQADWHVPFAHVSPAAHACPHEPQLFASLVSSTHEPPHDA